MNHSFGYYIRAENTRVCFTYHPHDVGFGWTSRVVGGTGNDAIAPKSGVWHNHFSPCLAVQIVLPNIISCPEKAKLRSSKKSL